MASITSVISLFVLLLATYCNAVPLKFTTEKPMLGHHTTDMMVEHTTFGNMMTGEHHAREESESGEHTTERVIKREEEEPTMKRTFEDFSMSSVDMTTEMHKIREMDEHKSESDSEEHTTERLMTKDEKKPIKRTFEDITFPSVELTTEMHKIRNMEFDDASFPTSTFDDVTDETRSFEHDKDMKLTTESLSHEAREFGHDSFTTLESSTEFADRAIRGSPEWFERQARASPEWFERQVRASPEWFERSARNYAEPEVEEEKVLPIKHISLDKIKTLEPSSSVDSYAKTTGLLHEEIKPIVTEIKTLLPVEDSYTHVEKIVPGTIHETKLLHEEMPHKEILVNDYDTKVIHHDILPIKKVLVNDYETKVFHDEIPMKKVLVNDYETKVFHDEIPMKKVLVNDYETKVFHDMPIKKVLVNDYETVKPALDEVKVKTVLTKKVESY